MAWVKVNSGFKIRKIKSDYCTRNAIKISPKMGRLKVRITTFNFWIIQTR
jgi:hypothetical protein